MDAPVEQTRSLPALEALRNGPPTVRVEEASKVLGVSRPFAYQMARDGLLPVLRLGPKRIRIITAGLLEMLEGQ